VTNGARHKITPAITVIQFIIVSPFISFFLDHQAIELLLMLYLNHHSGGFFWKFHPSFRYSPLPPFLGVDHFPNRQIRPSFPLRFPTSAPFLFFEAILDLRRMPLRKRFGKRSTIRPCIDS
jgi:hypothetical protein